jgi:hypothetical protein
MDEEIPAKKETPHDTSTGTDMPEGGRVYPQLPSCNNAIEHEVLNSELRPTNKNDGRWLRPTNKNDGR